LQSRADSCFGGHDSTLCGCVQSPLSEIHWLSGAGNSGAQPGTFPSWAPHTTPKTLKRTGAGNAPASARRLRLRLWR
jgi:hypothetical protein